MEEMSLSERAAYNIQTREEFAILKKKLGYLVEHHFGENSGVSCTVDGFNSYLKCADIRIKFYYKDLRGSELNDFFFRMGKMDLTVTSWFITWDLKMIDIRFRW